MSAQQASSARRHRRRGQPRQPRIGSTTGRVGEKARANSLHLFGDTSASRAGSGERSTRNRHHGEDRAPCQSDPCSLQTRRPARSRHDVGASNGTTMCWLKRRSGSLIVGLGIVATFWGRRILIAWWNARRERVELNACSVGPRATYLGGAGRRQAHANPCSSLPPIAS